MKEVERERELEKEEEGEGEERKGKRGENEGWWRWSWSSSRPSPVELNLLSRLRLNYLSSGRDLRDRHALPTDATDLPQIVRSDAHVFSFCSLCAAAWVRCSSCGIFCA